VHGCGAVALGVFAAIECLLEEAIVARYQRQHVGLRAAAGRQPAVGVVVVQRLQHDVQALFQHPAAGQHQHRHRAFRGGVQQRLGLVAQLYLAQFAGQAGIYQGQARAHGVGAATKRIQHGQGSHGWDETGSCLQYAARRGRCSPAQGLDPHRRLLFLLHTYVNK